MLKKFKGIIVYSKVHKDNDLFIKFLSNSDELISGIVYGGLSKKKRNILQVGFYLNFNVVFKANMPPSINCELSEPLISKIINDKYKLSCLMCIISLINLSIIEGQKIRNIYSVVDSFLINMFQDNKWFSFFCIFLFDLLKIIGYEIDISQSKNYKYFDLDLLEFKKFKTQSTVIFPYELINYDNNKIKIDSVNHVFTIFEVVFIKYHLANFNLKLPNQYHLFKKLIIDRLKL